LILVAILLIAVAASIMDFQKPGRIGWFLLCVLACAVALKHLWGDADYMCRKCGGRPTTRYNTLDYPSTIEIVDVPDQLTQKRYVGFWPDMYDLDEALEPPVQASSVHTVKETLCRSGKDVLITALAVPAVLLWFCITMVLALVGAVISGTKERH
jgi:hypothetical protein